MMHEEYSDSYLAGASSAEDAAASAAVMLAIEHCESNIALKTLPPIKKQDRVIKFGVA